VGTGHRGSGDQTPLAGSRGGAPVEVWEAKPQKPGTRSATFSKQCRILIININQYSFITFATTARKSNEQATMLNSTKMENHTNRNA